MKRLTRQLRQTARELEQGLHGGEMGAFFGAMGSNGVTAEDEAKVERFLGSERGMVFVDVCGGTRPLHIPTASTRDEKIVILLFAAAANETGDLT